MTGHRSVHAHVRGVVLAAGEGRRMGMPKALVQAGDGTTWLTRSARVLAAGGCEGLLVVVGAAAQRVRASYEGPAASFVVAADWRDGMGASLRAALEQGPGDGSVDALLVMLVDLPDVGPEVVRRVRDHVDAAETRGAVLARATYDGRPGHPVLVGRDHWGPMAATLAGDEGGRHYLAEHRASLIECGDLAGGRDQDTPTRTPGPE